MAKTRKVHVQFQEPELQGKITVVWLSKKFHEEPRKIRAALREMGLRAEKVGMRRQYVWDPKSRELRKVERALEKALS